MVPTERLLTRLWGDDTGESERSALQAYVSNLRRILDQIVQPQVEAVEIATLDRRIHRHPAFR